MAQCYDAFPIWVNHTNPDHPLNVMGQPFRCLPVTELNSILQSLTSRLPLIPPRGVPLAPLTFRNGPQAALACALSALTVATTLPAPALASIPLSSTSPQQEQQRRALGQLGLNTRSPVQNNNKVEEEPVSKQVERVTALMEEAATAGADGDWGAALRANSEIIAQYPDLALAERARVARGLLLYQIGKPEEALLQLEDEEVALRGNAEVHAAVAVICYDLGKTSQAEQQWTVATEFDSRYSDVYWVQKERHWPPKMILALEKFFNLS